MDDSDGVTASDEVLVERARSGDERAFGELWRRHYRSGVRVARQFTSIDADDLVSESYLRIFARVRAGGGPSAGFRAYLYTCIRNLASSWGSARREYPVDDLSEFEDLDPGDDPALIALDRTLTACAFRSLPERWQTVLWYTEVEGMDPHEVAPIMGLTANGVAALSYRAREGLRKAWLQAHINSATTSGECQWALDRMGDHARDGLGARDSERMRAHLSTCASCAIVSEELEEVGSHLALVLIPLTLGSVAGGTLLASLGQAQPAMAVAIPDAPDLSGLPEAVGAGADALGGAGLLGGAGAPVALIGGLALAVAATTAGIVVVGSGAPEPPAIVAEQPAEPALPALPERGPVPAVDPAAVPGERAPDGIVIEVVDGVVGDVGDLVDGVVGTVTGGQPPPGHTAPGDVAGIDLSLSGTGTPGAHLSLQGAGQVYATTTVNSDGSWALAVTGIPGGLSSLDLVQTVDRSYLAGLVGGGGLLGEVLGSLDALIDGLIRPLGLSSGGGTIDINLVG